VVEVTDSFLLVYEEWGGTAEKGEEASKEEKKRHFLG